MHSYTMQQSQQALRCSAPRGPLGLVPFQRGQRSQAAHRPQQTSFSRRFRTAAESQQVKSSTGEGDEEDLSDKVEEFLRQQAQKESGAAAVEEERPQHVLGDDVVSDADAKRYCREVMSAVKQLRQSRDMSVNEIKLTLAIEDPTARERRDYLGIEEDAGLSRDEIAAALMEVVGGRIPLDRIALRELHRELIAWPFLDSVEELQAEQQADSNYGGVTDTGLKKGQKETKREGQARPPVGRDKSETPQKLVDMLPDWMGYGFLYFVSVIPVLIVITTISILFFSSLK